MPKEPIRPNIGNIKPYLPGKPAEEAERELRITGMIKLASNENPLGPSPKAIEIINKYSKDVSLYPDQNCFELTKLLSEKLDLPPDNIVIGNGSDEIMMLAALAFISAGDEVVVSHNTFSTYETVSNIMEADVQRINLNNFRYDLKAMADVTSERTKLIFICNPNNPTGTMNTRSELDYVVSKASANTIVFIDEAYCEYATSQDFPNSLEYVKSKKNVIVTRTFSKVHGLAGLRIGYGIARPELIRYMKLVRMPFSVGRIAQQAAMASLSDLHHIEASKMNNEEGKAYLYAALDKLGVNYVKTEANFIMLNLNNDADVIFMELMRKGVIVRPLASFGLPGSIRVTIGTPEQNGKFVRSLTEVLRR